MKNQFVSLCIGLMIIFLISCTTSGQQDPITLYGQIDRSPTTNTLAAQEKDNGWVLLFDGKSTSGWHGFNLKMFPDSWVIENGVFTTTTKGGHEDLDLVTDKEYSNFALSLDFKMMKGTNSGIIFQIHEDPKYKFPYETGPEFQIIDQAGWPDPLQDWQICGANYAMYPPKSLPCNPTGEWNHLLLVVDGNHVSQIINGVIVVQYEKYTDEWNKLRASGKWANFPDYGKFDKGNISLQNHGTQVWFRNIKLKEFSEL